MKKWMRCGSKYFVYLLNDSPAPATVPVSFGVAGRQLAAQTFTPGTSRYQSLGQVVSKNHLLTLPALTLAPQQEVVLVVATGQQKTLLIEGKMLYLVRVGCPGKRHLHPLITVQKARFSDAVFREI